MTEEILHYIPEYRARQIQHKEMRKIDVQNLDAGGDRQIMAPEPDPPGI